MSAYSQTPKYHIYVCPACRGHGTTSKPPWVAGDVQTWAGSTIENYPCQACTGNGYLVITDGS